MKVNLIFIIIISIFGCHSNIETYSERSENMDTLHKTLKRVKQFSTPPIDIDSLKLQDWLTTTSGIIAKKDLKLLCEPRVEGFYGVYFLIDKLDNKKPFGKLTVHNKEQSKDWKFENKDDKFVKIELNSNRIKLWDNIGIGNSEDELLSFIGDYFHYKKGLTIYATIEGYSSNFRIISDTINQIKIEEACN